MPKDRLGTNRAILGDPGAASRVKGIFVHERKFTTRTPGSPSMESCMEKRTLLHHSQITQTRSSGRPIVSSNSHPTERISEFVDFRLQPLVTKLPSYIKDTTHFIGPLPDGVLLVTLDISSLYTNVPHKDGIQACSEFLDRRVNPAIQTTRLCDLIRMILTNNTFAFNGQQLQTSCWYNDGNKNGSILRQSFRGEIQKNRPRSCFTFSPDLVALHQ